MLKLDYDALYKLSLSHPEKVWDEIAKEVEWSKSYTSVIDDKHFPIPKWFIGGEINMSYNCLDKAIEEGYGNDFAIIHESPVTESTRKITYKELLREVELLAGVMVDKCAVKKGDRVLLYFPVVPECVIGMLACTRLGAIYSVVFGGFSAKEICRRLEHTESKLILTCNVAFEPGCVINYKERIDEAIKQSKFTPDHCIVFNRPNSQPSEMVDGRDFDWNSEIQGARPHPVVPLESDHPMFIIYTSGSTGEPKGLVMRTGNSVVIDKYTFKYLLNIKERENYWIYSDFGWISGQTVMTYGPFLRRSTTILYEGKPVTTPDAGQIFRILNKYKVVCFVVPPTVMRILRNFSCPTDLQLAYTDLRSVFIGGELSDSDLRKWLSSLFKCPIYEVYGQTELNGIITFPCVGFGRQPNSNSIMSLGFEAIIIDDINGEEVSLETEGDILLKVSNNPGIAATLYKDHKRFIEKYFSKYPGYFDTYDRGKLMKDGSLVVLSRTDDVIHVSSIRVCGGALEECCLRNLNLINAAVVPMNDPITGQVPFGFLIKRKNYACDEQTIINDTIDLVEKYFGKFVMFKNAVIVPDLPHTNTHKISRYSLASMINLNPFKVPATVENPDIFQAIYNVLTNAGYKAILPSN